MTLQELRYFCVTAEVLHYTRASRLLYISQPSLSYAINKLEQELGVPLFEKNGKKVTLTKYGEEFLPFAKRALSELSEGTERLREMKVPYSGGVSMGYIYSVSFSALPEFVNRFYTHQGSEQIAFRFRQGMAGELVEQLMNGTLDFLIAGKPDIASLDYLPFYRQELFLIVPATHRLADKKSVLLSDPILPILDSFNVRTVPFADSSMYRDVCVLRSSSHEMTPELKSIWDFAEQISASFIDASE